MSKIHFTRLHLHLALTLGIASGCDAAYGKDSVTPDNVAEPAALATGYHGRKLSVDVVADCNRFTSGGVGHPNANPKFGDYFMQEGFIYKAGTLAKHCAGGDGCGLNPDGTPQFPEAVLGKWTCYGSFVGKGGATTRGTWLYSTQVFEFGAQQLEPNVFSPGEHTVISLGSEPTDLGVPFSRPISGGTGRFRSALGEVVQTRIGFNPTTCENFTFDFDLDTSRR